MKFVLISFLALLILLLASCTANETANDFTSYPNQSSEGDPFPIVYVDGRFYWLVFWGVRQELLDETFTLIGEISSFERFITGGDANLQTNVQGIIGSPIYHSGDNLIVVFDGIYIHFRYGEQP